MENLPLFVGTANAVCAVDRATGQLIWRTTLNEKFFKMGSSFVNLEFDGESLFAAVFGELFCLDPSNGRIRWRIPLKGSSQHLVTFASSASNNRAAAEAKRERDDT